MKLIYIKEGKGKSNNEQKEGSERDLKFIWDLMKWIHIKEDKHLVRKNRTDI